PRVDVHDRERELARPERPLREPKQHDRVLAAGEEEHGPLELGRDLAEDVDRLRLELVEVGQGGHGRAHDGTSAGTRFSSASRASTCAADSLGDAPVVSRRSSGSIGSSYGAETPVKSSISPANAAA